MWALLRTVAFGFIGYISPRFAIALGVPLDQWVVEAANYITASNAAITKEEAEFAVTIALTLLGATSAIWFPRSDQWNFRGKPAPRRRVELLLPITASIVFGLAFVGSLTWLYRVASVASAPAPNVVTLNIAVECKNERLPKTFSPNSDVHVLNLFATPVANGGRGLAIQFNHSGKDWSWPDDDKFFPPAAYLCLVTNYSAIPVFDFEMRFDLEFYEAVSVPNQPNAKTAGALKLKRDWPIDIAKIDPGPSNSFSFYIVNNNADQIVQLMLPKSATMRALGSHESQSVSLTTPHLGGTVPLFFGPRFKDVMRVANDAKPVAADPTPPPANAVHRYIVEGLTTARADLLSIKKEALTCEALHQWQIRASTTTRLAHANGIGIHNPITQHTGACQNITDKDLIDAIRTRIVDLLDQGIQAANSAGR